MTPNEIKDALTKIAMGRRDSIDALTEFLASLQPAPATQPAAIESKKASKNENG